MTKCIGIMGKIFGHKDENFLIIHCFDPEKTFAINVNELNRGVTDLLKDMRHQGVIKTITSAERCKRCGRGYE